MLNPTEQMTAAMENIACQVPLQCIDKCKYKKYPKLPRKLYEVEESKYLQDVDTYWANFLQAQADSSAKYLYSMNFYGNAQDPTMIRKDPFPSELIHQRLIHMPVVGPLTHTDMFYILSFMLNLLMLSPEVQMQVLGQFQQQNLVDNEILTYMQIISRHPNTGLTEEEKSNFHSMTQELINKDAAKGCSADYYFNPDHIFKKSLVQIDPYELAHLKHIMEINDDLTKAEFLYLTNFVERLEEMPSQRRDKYIALLHQMQVLPSAQFQTLLYFLHGKCKPFDTERLKVLFKSLETLLNIEETLPKPAMEIPKKPIKKTHIEINVTQVRKALEHLMKGGIPNIVRLNDLKAFIRGLMEVQQSELEMLLNTMRISISRKQYKFLRKFIQNGKMLGPANKLKVITDTIEKVLATPSEAPQQQTTSSTAQPTTSTSSANTTKAPPRQDKSNDRGRASSSKRASRGKPSTPQKAAGKGPMIEIKSTLKEEPNDENVLHIDTPKQAPKVQDETSKAQVQFSNSTESLERKRGGSDTKRSQSYLEATTAESTVPAKNQSELPTNSRTSSAKKRRVKVEEEWQVNSDIELLKTKIIDPPVPAEPTPMKKFKVPKVDYFAYPPPRRCCNTTNEYLIETSRGPIPLIRNRTLWFQFPMRDRKVNKVVSIKDGVLQLK